MPLVIQSSYARGVLSPELEGRVDTQAYQAGLRTGRNAVVHQYGGISNRPGLRFIGPVGDHTRVPRLIEFQFKSTDTHIIEMGHEYIRIIRNDAHVTETAVNVSGATQANPVVVTTSEAHGYTTGDEVFLTGIGGMTDISEERWKIIVLTTTTFSLQDQATGVNVDGTSFSAYTSGGTTARIFQLTTPYQEDDLFDITYSQTADVITFAHPSYDVRELQRLALANWQLVTVSFAPAHSAPSNFAASAGTAGADTVKYKVTAVSTETEEESLPGLSGDTPLTITNVTQADPAVVTVTSHGLDDGDEIEIAGIVGMTELNGRRFKINDLTANTFSLRDTDSTGFTAYTSGGTATKAFEKLTSVDNSVYDNTLTWDSVPGTRLYSVYREENGLYGFIGDTESLTFTDKAALSPNFSETPPQQRNPFFGADNRPGAVGQFQQRRVFGGSNNGPDTSYYSRTGVFSNFSISIPQRDDDAITVALPADEVNQILHYVTLKELLMFTTGAEWAIRGSLDTGFSATTITQDPQSNWGSSNLRPIVVGTTVLFVLDDKRTVRALFFSAEKAGFPSNNITRLIPHLVRNRNLTDWAFSYRPDPLIYAVRNDGECLVCAFEEEERVIAWTHWDTFGAFESVASTRPLITSLEDSAFFVVRRKIDGNTVRYIERTVPRNFEVVQDAFFVDSGLTHDVPWVMEGATSADPVVVTITGHPFVNGDEVHISDVVWVANFDDIGNETQPEQLNGGKYIIANATANTFELTSIEDGSDIDGSAFNAYVGGGFVRKAVNQLSGLRHLRNEQVSILADGDVLAPQTVSSVGTLTLPDRYSRIHIGLPYTTDIETLRMTDPPESSVTVQGRLKHAARLHIVFERSRGMLYGPTNTELTEWAQREFEAYGEPTNLFTGVESVTLSGNWNIDGRLFIRQKDPLPMTILAVVPDFEVGD